MVSGKFLHIRTSSKDDKRMFYLLYPLTTAPAQPAGLVTAYSFDGASGTVVAYTSVSNNTDTLGGGIIRTSQGKFGNAVFNGSSFVTIPDAASLDLTARMTVYGSSLAERSNAIYTPRPCRTVNGALWVRQPCRLTDGHIQPPITTGLR
jgi:hypothetical protein